MYTPAQLREKEREWAAEARSYIQNPYALIKSGRLRIRSGYYFDEKGQLVRPPKPGLYPFRPDAHQKRLLDFCFIHWQKLKLPRKIMVVKGRKQHISGATQALIFSLARSESGKTATIVSSDPKSASEVFNFTRIFHEGLAPTGGTAVAPHENPYLQLETSLNNQQQIVFNDDRWNIHSSVIRCRNVMDGINLGAGSDSLLNHWTEYGGWCDDEQAETVRNMVVQSEESVTIIESISQGGGTSFAKEASDCWGMQGKANYWEKGFNLEGARYSPYIAMFFPAWQSTPKETPLPEGTAAEDFAAVYDDYEKELSRLHILPYLQGIGLSPEQAREACARKLLWRRGMLRTCEYSHSKFPVPPPLGMSPSRSLHRFQMEHPFLFDEAFKLSNSLAFGPDVMDKQAAVLVGAPAARNLSWMDRSKRPPTCIVAPRDGGQGSGARNVIFRDVDGEPVSVGVDVASGEQPDDDKSDFSAAVGIGRRSGQQKFEIEVKARPRQFACDYLDPMLWYYASGDRDRLPLLAIERNSYGLQLVNYYIEEFDNGRGYPSDKLYRRQKLTKEGRAVFADQVGFFSDTAAQDIVLTELSDRILANGLKVFSKKIFEQMQHFIVKPGGKKEAATKGKGGIHSKDDLLDALLIANFADVEMARMMGLPEDGGKTSVDRGGRGVWDSLEAAFASSEANTWAGDAAEKVWS